MNRLEFHRLATERLDDAIALLQAGRSSGAYYLAGYAVECALKACIARQTKEHDFPPKDAAKLYTHDIQTLLRLAGLESSLSKEWSGNPALRRNREAVREWSEDARYQIWTQRKAEQLTTALSDPENGILQCLRKDW